MFLSPLEFQTDLELPLASLPSLPEVSDGPHCDGLSRAHLLDLIMLVTRHPDRSVMEAALAILRRNDGPEGEARAALRVHHRAACFCGEPQRDAAVFEGLGWTPEEDAETERREVQFAANMERLTRSIMGMWQSLPGDCWPPDVRRSTAAQRKDNYDQVKRLTLANTKQSNLASTQIVLNCDRAFVDLMRSEGVFDASRAFGDQARQFDKSIQDAEEFQAGRNAWAAFGLQLRAGERADCNTAVLGYSLLYPYSDNYLDDAKEPPAAKAAFQNRFRGWLAGEAGEGPQTPLEEKVKGCVDLVEKRWDRQEHPDVFWSLVAINDAQTASLQQHVPLEEAKAEEILHITSFKGGTSVLADLYITVANPALKEQVFAFAFGFALQVVDDIQDMEADLKDSQQTLMTLAADRRDLVYRLFHFLHLILHSEQVAEKGMRSMCYTMVLKQVSRVQKLFTPAFVAECEALCPLPMPKMSRLAGMRTLLKMVREDRL